MVAAAAAAEPSPLTSVDGTRGLKFASVRCGLSARSAPRVGRL